MPLAEALKKINTPISSIADIESRVNLLNEMLPHIATLELLKTQLSNKKKESAATAAKLAIRNKTLFTLQDVIDGEIFPNYIQLSYRGRAVEKAGEIFHASDIGLPCEIISKIQNMIKTGEVFEVFSKINGQYDVSLRKISDFIHIYPEANKTLVNGILGPHISKIVLEYLTIDLRFYNHSYSCCKDIFESISNNSFSIGKYLSTCDQYHSSHPIAIGINKQSLVTPLKLKGKKCVVIDPINEDINGFKKSLEAEPFGFGGVYLNGNAFLADPSKIMAHYI